MHCVECTFTLFRLCLSFLLAFASSFLPIVGGMGTGMFRCVCSICFGVSNCIPHSPGCVTCLAFQTTGSTLHTRSHVRIGGTGTFVSLLVFDFVRLSIRVCPCAYLLPPHPFLHLTLLDRTCLGTVARMQVWPCHSCWPPSPSLPCPPMTPARTARLLSSTPRS